MKKIRCNFCMWVGDEEDLIVDYLNTEHCRKCSKEGNLVDIEINVESFMNSNYLSKEDSEEIIDIIIYKEEVTNIEDYDFIKAYEDSGATWSKSLLEEYYNMDCEVSKEKPKTIEEILALDYVFILPSGLIFTWKY